MENFTPPEGWASTGETAEYCKTSKSKLGEYRNRDWFSTELWVKDGNRIFYDMEKVSKILDENVPTRSRKLGSVEVENALMKMGIPSKEISEARKSFHEAEEREIKVKKARGELVDFAGVKNYVSQQARIHKDRLFTIPDRLASPLSAEDDPTEIARMIHDELSLAVNELFREYLEDEG